MIFKSDLSISKAFEVRRKNLSAPLSPLILKFIPIGPYGSIPAIASRAISKKTGSMLEPSCSGCKTYDNPTIFSNPRNKSKARRVS